MINTKGMQIPYRSGMDGDRAGALAQALGQAQQVQSMSPMERGGPSLADQIRSQWGGNWDEAGIDRAKELSDLLGTQGITSLGDLSLTKGVNPDPYNLGPIDPSFNIYNDENDPDGTNRANYTENRNVPYQQLKLGDKTFGYLGDYNNDGSFGSKSNKYLQGNGLENNPLVGWSSRGHGNVDYRTGINPETGKLEIRPNWNSSSDANTIQGDLRGLGQVLGGAYGLNSEFGGLSGAAASGAGASNGAFLGEGFTSGVPAWDAAASGTGLGIGEAAGTVASNTSQLTPAALESLIGTPGYGYNAAAEIAGSGIPGYAGSGANALMGFDNIANPGLWDGSSILPPSDQSINIIGQRPLTPSPSLPNLSGTAALPALQSISGSPTDADYSNEGRNHPPTEADKPWYEKIGNNLKNVGGNYLDRLINLDPTAIQQGIGGLGALKSLFGGNDGPSARVFPGQGGGGGGAGGGASNDNWTAAQQPNVQKYFDRQPQPFSWTPRPQGYAGGGGVRGQGSGQDDVVSIMAAPGEYVFDADTVASLGDGSNEAGVRVLDDLRRKLRQHKRSGPMDEIPPRAKSPLEYLE